MAKIKHFLVILVTLVQNLLSEDNQGLSINVRIQENVPNHLCHRFFTNLEVRRAEIAENISVFALWKLFQDLFIRASDQLEYETGSGLGLITFHLPPSMLTPSCSSNLTVSRLTSSSSGVEDVVVSARDPVFGDNIFSVQHQGCGERGLRVVLPSSSLIQSDNVTDDMGELIQKSWYCCTCL